MSWEEDREKRLDEIRREAEGLPIPESLEPERMMERIDAYEENRRPEGADGKEGKSGRPAWLRGTARLAVLAACFGVAVLAFRYMAAGPAGRAPMTAEGTAAVPEAAAGAAMETEATEDEAGSPYQADSYEEVYQVLRELDEREQKEMAERRRYYSDGVMLETEAAMTMAAAPEEGVQERSSQMAGSSGMEAKAEAVDMDLADAGAEAGAGSVGNADFSDTNVQVEGVDEGDIVKTDGSYLYIADMDERMVRIVKADGGKMEQVGAIDAGTASMGSIQEFYVAGDRLSVVQQYYLAEAGREVEPLYRSIPYAEDSAPYYGSTTKGQVRVTTFDISDRADPKTAGSVELDGEYSNSRRSGDYLYVFASYWHEAYGEPRDYKEYLPKIEGETIPYDCIYLPENIDGRSFQVILSVDLEDPGKPLEQKAVMAGGENLYVSAENIYIGTTRYDGRADQYNYTELLKLSYKDGRIRFAAHGLIDGYLNDQFSMDEYKGNLRVVATLSHRTGVDTNSLYVLDGKLEKIGEIEDLAPDEQIYSARFMGDTGYFVTFRNMDPLFSVDLKDPRRPKVLGELKITGFSEYLHPFGDGLLLGVGREMDPDTGNFEGMKLSMFDTSNPSDVEEVQKVVEEEYEYTTAWYNHKAVLVSAKQKLVGLTVERVDKSTREWGCAYVAYRWQPDSGFEKVFEYSLEDGRDSDRGESGLQPDLVRGLYIGEYLYVVQEGQVTSFDMADWRQEDKLRLR